MGPPIILPTASQNRALRVPSEPVILLSTLRSVQMSDWSKILNIGRKLHPIHDRWIRLSKKIPEYGSKIRTLRAFINSAQLDLSGWSIFLQLVRSNHTSFWSETFVVIHIWMWSKRWSKYIFHILNDGPPGPAQSGTAKSGTFWTVRIVLATTINP